MGALEEESGEHLRLDKDVPNNNNQKNSLRMTWGELRALNLLSSFSEFLSQEGSLFI